MGCYITQEYNGYALADSWRTHNGTTRVFDLKRGREQFTDVHDVSMCIDINDDRYEELVEYVKRGTPLDIRASVCYILPTLCLPMPRARLIDFWPSTITFTVSKVVACTEDDKVELVTNLVWRLFAPLESSYDTDATYTVSDFTWRSCSEIDILK